MRKIVLASKSPRRQELIKDIVNDFIVVVSDVEETVPCGTKPEDIPVYLAKLKAFDVSKKCEGDIVIGSDTVVIVDDKVLNKPVDEDDAFNMLRLLSGRTHKVCTGCAIVCDGVCTSFLVETIVEFYSLSDEEIKAYISTGDCMDKAGAYGVQSQGKTLVKGICGDYYNVVGLPVARLKRELEAFVMSIDK